MRYVDTSSVVDNASCYALSSASTLLAYKGNVRYSYYLVNDKWVFANTTTYNVLPNTTCITRDALGEIPAQSAVYEPIFGTMAAGVALFIIFVSYKLVIKPLLSRRV